MATIDRMDVTPQLLHDVEFREAKRGGYNTQDVDEFLERLAVGLERQEALVREIRQRVDAAEARAGEAERRAALAEQSASNASASDETLKRTLVLAQRTADAAIREAEEQAAQTLAAAQAEAEQLRAEAHDAFSTAQSQAEQAVRQSQEEARARVMEEMHVLEATRDRLQEDVEILERHLDEQRARVRIAIDELQRMLDDPGSLYEVDLPVVSGVVAPVAEVPPSEAAAPAGWVPDEDAWGDADLVGEVGEDDDVDAPATEAVDVLPEYGEDDDAYLTELRKAMTDETPLGPRDPPLADPLFDEGAAPERSRFGRKR